MTMSKPVIIQSEHADQQSAAEYQQARVDLDTSRPTRIIDTIVPTPRGAITRPVSITG